MKLTARQIQVLTLLADGLTAKEIGQILEISPRTIEIHASLVRAKMAAKNNTHAVVKAIREKLIQ